MDAKVAQKTTADDLALRIATRYAEELAKKPGRLSGEVRAKWKKILTTREPFGNGLEHYPAYFKNYAERLKRIDFEWNVHPRGMPSETYKNNMQRETDSIHRNADDMKSKLKWQSRALVTHGQLDRIKPILRDAEAASVPKKRIQAVQAALDDAARKLKALAEKGWSLAENFYVMPAPEEIQEVVAIIKEGDETLDAAYKAAATLLR